MLGSKIARYRAVGLLEEAGSALDSAGVDPAVLGSHIGLLSRFPVLHELSHGVVVQVFVKVLVVDLDHRGVDAGAQTLNLLQSKQTVGACLVHLDAVEVLHRLDDVASLQTSQ